MRIKLISILLIGLLGTGWLTAFAQTEGVQVEYVTQQQGNSSVTYPQLSGMPNTFAQDTINRSIMADGGITSYLAMLSALTDPAATGLKVSAHAEILPAPMGNLLAVRMVAEGRIGPGRPGYAVTPLMYNLLTGQRVHAKDFFVDVSTAAGDIEAMIARDVESDVSAYLSAGGLYPVPIKQLLADEVGITFFYDQAQYTTLSGRSGAVHFLYDDLMPLLHTTPGSVLGDLLQKIPRAPSSEAAQAIAQTVQTGTLPGLSITLGVALDEVLVHYPMLTDPDGFPTGTKYQPEDASWRGTAFIEANGRVTGILSNRASLYGLTTGKADRELVVQTLGQPVGSIALDDQAAMQYGMVAGALESYAYQGNTLYFNYDADSTLRYIWLSLDESHQIG